MIFHNLLGSILYHAITYTLILAMTATSSIPIIQRVQAIADTYTGLVQQVTKSATTSTTSALDAITAALPQDLPIPTNHTSLAQDTQHETRNTNHASRLSVSRVQSAYTPGDAVSGTLVLTFTITNNQPPVLMPQISENATLTETAAALQAFDATSDPNAIHDVLLVDTLTAEATFIFANPRADYKDDTYTWNLGSIPPMKSITATLTLQVPTSVVAIVTLDTGATAWGTLEGEMISASACPATLAPATLSEYLQPSVDADFHDDYVAKRAGQLCPNPTDAFEYVSALGYEAYKGSLRGARGAEWSQAGNSLDQSNLLVAMLRGNGVPARYRHGTLDDARAQELILSMFPTTGAVVGYVPEDVEVSDPVNDPDLLAEARDHWWVEAYIDGDWTAMDPSFSYADLGQTFTTPVGEPYTEIPDEMRHKVTVTIEIEKYDMLSYLSSGFSYETPLTYTFTTAELVGNPLTLEHLSAHETPPMGYLIFGWVYYTYVPYLRLGDNETIIEGTPFWELLSNYPFGQFAVTAEFLHFDVQDTDGNTTRYTRQIADRVKAGPQTGPLRQPKMVRGLMTADVISSLGPGALPLVHQADTHTIYFNPSWMSREYAAHVGEDLMVTVPRIAKVESIAAGLGALEEGYQANFGAVELAEMSDLVAGTSQAFDRMLGASFVTMSDRASRDLAETGQVATYPNTPRITIASSVISMSKEVSQTAQLQILDLLHDSVRAIAYPGQARGAEQVYHMTRGVCNTFMETAVGEALTGEESKSAANVLEEAQAQGIPLLYVDADRLDVLAQAEISTQAKAFIMDAVQKGYGVLVPERMVEWQGAETIAWWQLNLETGEMVGIGENGTHDFITFATMFLAGFMITLHVVWLITLLWKLIQWRNAMMMTWQHFWREQVMPRAMNQTGGDPQQIYKDAFKATRTHMQEYIKEHVGWLSRTPWWAR